MKRRNCTALVAAMWLAAAAVSAAYAAEMPPLEQTAGYDIEYPHINYTDPARGNCIAQLREKLDDGQLRLARDAKHGYLPALLKALDIDVDSQVMVYSKTSLQFELVTPSTPRAIYFNDECYVAYVQGTPFLEFAALDAKRGVVFYTLDDRLAAPRFDRQGNTCLACHDTFSMTGGGVPRVLASSAVTDAPMDSRPMGPAQEVTDRTPLSLRWGGWYVTGRQGKQQHLGNQPVRESTNTRALETLSPQNRRTLKDYYDTSKYLTPNSDLTALLVLEHQSTIQNQIMRVNYKLPSVLARLQMQGRDNRTAMAGLVEPLVKALFFDGAAQLDDAIEGNTDFAKHFVERGPVDSQGRNLRAFDLKTRVFRWPLSYLVYSQAFDSLSEPAWNYAADRIVQVLRGEDTTGLSERISAEDRAAVIQILQQTHPRLAQRLAATDAR
ncbi:MAG: hypothetical protein LBE59_02325 [Nevskiaceae bacterium]|jgi:hypothetical protein|nr:hypothetical protein [Nevskiaceae bacterium]